ncbi:very short patch repair endonuclease [Phascolarctobacterium sp. Marseille-Q4147]|uniref:very short patch repair endonuclease n=1 Tax=Phascolarctobacterium sp. Marseille-Q4147 TaxID=2823317 RepID=UPI001B341535|nr:very short patch repair endonuclease [Phascolarctobacterium sp. Marseille-Q4147]
MEILLRKALWHEGIRYRKNYKVCSCHPDIVITKYKIAVFCDGEFWHGKSLERYDVATNVKYWHEKIRRNVERDLENTIELRDNGWMVLRFWETEIKKHLADCLAEVQRCIDARRSAVKRK